MNAEERHADDAQSQRSSVTSVFHELLGDGLAKQAAELPFLVQRTDREGKLLISRQKRETRRGEVRKFSTCTFRRLEEEEALDALEALRAQELSVPDGIEQRLAAAMYARMPIWHVLVKGVDEPRRGLPVSIYFLQNLHELREFAHQCLIEVLEVDDPTALQTAASNHQFQEWCRQWYQQSEDLRDTKSVRYICRLSGCAVLTHCVRNNFGDCTDFLLRSHSDLTSPEPWLVLAASERVQEPKEEEDRSVPLGAMDDVRPTPPGTPNGIVRRRTVGGLSNSASDTDLNGPRRTFVRAGRVVSTALSVQSPASRNSLRSSLRAVTIGDDGETSRSAARLSGARLSRGPKRFSTVEVVPIPEVIESKALAKPQEKVFSGNTNPGEEALAVNLARKHRLSLIETKTVATAFKEAARNDTGGLDVAEFKKLMCKVFDVTNINPDVLENAYEQTGIGKVVSLETFMAWYVQNMFTQVNALHACSDSHSGNSLTYSLSDKHEVSVSVIDNIKRQFDKYDLDKSGEIDFEEFTEMMCILLKAKKESVSEMRLRKFWREIEKGADGDIGFVGFTAWYLKYFNSDDDFENPCPVEAMYASFNPSVQRNAFLDKNPLII